MDVRSLRKHCESTIPLIEELKDSKPTPKKLLHALLEKTIEQIDQGIYIEDIMFTSVELAALVKNDSIDEKRAKKFKSDHYSETKKLLNKTSELKKLHGIGDLKYKLELHDTGEKGGAKNKKHHFLKLVEDSPLIEKPSINSDNHCVIEYSAVQLPKASWLAKPFMSIELSSWRYVLFLAIPISIILGSLILFLSSLFLQSLSIVAFLINFISVSALVVLFIYPFYVANNLRITIAPQWMMPLRKVTAQLESVKVEKYRSNGRSYRKVEYVIYEGVCPVCGSLVDVEKGKGAFKQRLIGVCSESPREHIFSFDHVTKKGKLLLN